MSLHREDPPTADEPIYTSTRSSDAYPRRRNPPDPDSAEDIEQQLLRAAAANDQANQANDDMSVTSNLTFSEDGDHSSPIETINESLRTKTKQSTTGTKRNLVEMVLETSHAVIVGYEPGLISNEELLHIKQDPERRIDFSKSPLNNESIKFMWVEQGSHSQTALDFLGSQDPIMDGFSIHAYCGMPIKDRSHFEAAAGVKLLPQSWEDFYKRYLAHARSVGANISDKNFEDYILNLDKTMDEFRADCTYKPVA